MVQSGWLNKLIHFRIYLLDIDFEQKLNFILKKKYTTT